MGQAFFVAATQVLVLKVCFQGLSEHDQMSRPDLVADIENSERKAESIQDWWNCVHQRNHPFWLSGTRGPEVWERLDVTRILQGDSSAGKIFRWFRPKRQLIILNIGVGLGLCTRDLAAIGCDVHAFDISPLALQRVTDVATTWLASDAARLPANTFDLALSHLVAQHMTNADLAVQLSTVIRALKPSGLFAMQYSSLDTAGKPANEQLSSAKSGSVFRDPSTVANMVREAGGGGAREANSAARQYPLAHRPRQAKSVAMEVLNIQMIKAEAA